MKHLHHLWRIMLVCALALSSVITHAQEQLRPLEPGKQVERELSGGQTHLYTVTLNANQIARIVAERKGVDLTLSALAPDGTKLFDVGGPNGAQGEESATIVARQSGAYRVLARAPQKAAPAGRYAIRLDKFLTESEQH